MKNKIIPYIIPVIFFSLTVALLLVSALDDISPTKIDKVEMVVRYETFLLIDNRELVAGSQVFFNCGNGLSDETYAELTFPIFQTKQNNFPKTQRLSSKVEIENPIDIRIDPLTVEGTIHLKSITFFSKGLPVYSLTSQDIIRYFMPQNGIVETNLGNDDFLKISSTGLDPQLVSTDLFREKFPKQLADNFHTAQLMQKVIVVTLFVVLLLLTLITYKYRLAIVRCFSFVCQTFFRWVLAIKPYLIKAVKMLNNKFFYLTDAKYKYIAVVISVFIYLAMSLWFLFQFYEVFAIDEYFHIATLNPSFETTYNRAVYINFMEKIFVQLFGYSALTVKLLPFMLGIISFSCLLYLSYKFFHKPISLFVVAFLMTFHPLLLFNHNYIRMYIFLEAIIMVGGVLIYHAYFAKLRNKPILCGALLAFYCAIHLFYVIFTNDSSRYAALLLFVATIFLFFFGERLITLIKTKRAAAIGFGVLILLAIGLEIFAILIKSNIIILPQDITANSSFIYTLIDFYTSDTPVFLLYFLTDGLLLTIAFIWSGYYLITSKNELPRLLFFSALLPFAAYLCLYYNSNMFRTFTPYLPLIFWVSMFCIEYHPFFQKGRSILAVLAACAVVCFSYPADFFKMPSVTSETAFTPLGTLFDIAGQYQQTGKKVISITVSRLVEQFYQFHADQAFYVSDASREPLVDALNEAFQGTEPYMVIVDVNGYWMMADEPDVLTELESYPCISVQSLYKIYYIN